MHPMEEKQNMLDDLDAKIYERHKCESTFRIYMSRPWGHTDKLPPIIRTRRDWCRLRIPKWLDKLRLPSQIMDIPLPHKNRKPH